MKNSGEAKLLLVMGLFVLLGGGALVWMNRAPGTGGGPNPSPTAAPTPAPIAWDDAKFRLVFDGARHVRGPENAPFSAVEFADFECASCRKAYNQGWKKLEESGRVRFAFHHFPWPYHTNAVPAALATEAAHEQGKFWEMYDALFDKDEVELSDAYITEQAKKVGLDMARFDKAREGAALMKWIEADKALGEKVGVASTPTIVFRDNKTGQYFQAVGATELKAAMERILGTQAAAPSPAASTPTPTATP
jgi:protein-disulfide isomerase